MEYRPIGASGIEASVVAFGAWAIGGWMWGGTDRENAIAAIRASIDAGANFIDTAPAYGLGLSEEIVGEAIAGRRKDVVIATKCGLQWHAAKGTFFFTQQGKDVYRYLGAESIRYEVEQSLKRLGTDYIDLYQTHWQDATTPIEETMGALLELKKEGKIRAIGVSNISLDQLEVYRAVGTVDSAQERYSMLDREIEAELLPYCRKNGISVLAYSPIAQGLLTGKVDPDREFPEGDLRRGNPRFSVQNRRRVLAMIDEFKPVADRHGITIAQLVIAWTVAQPGLTHALVGARDAQQAQENARAGSVVLSEEDLQTIGGALARYA